MNAKDFRYQILPIHTKLLRYADRILQDTEQARDVIQDVFLKLWQKKEHLKNIDNVEAYAIQITKNRCFDLLKRQQTEQLQQHHEQKIASTTTILDTLELSEAARQVRQLIHRLPPLQRIIMQMRDLEQLNYEEIAEITGLSVNAVRVNLSRARKKVREHYKNNNHDEPARYKKIDESIF